MKFEEKTPYLKYRLILTPKEKEDRFSFDEMWILKCGSHQTIRKNIKEACEKGAWKVKKIYKISKELT